MDRNRFRGERNDTAGEGDQQYKKYRAAGTAHDRLLRLCVPKVSRMSAHGAPPAEHSLCCIDKERSEDSAAWLSRRSA